MRAGTRRWWRPLLAATSICALVASAFVAHGVQAAHVDADDAAVWVVAPAQAGGYVVERVNTRIAQYDNRPSAPHPSPPKILQNGRDVAVFDSKSLQRIDAADPTGIGSSTQRGRVQLGGSEPLAIGGPIRDSAGDGSVVAVRTRVGADKFVVRAVPFGALEGALASVPTRGLAVRRCVPVAAVSPTGRVFAVVAAAQGSSFEIVEVGRDGTLTARASLRIQGVVCSGEHQAMPQMVVVGETPIVLLGQQVQVGGAVQQLQVDQPVLQDVASVGSTVLVAGTGSLFELALAGGSARRIEATGVPSDAQPIRPVRAGDGTEYAGWTSGQVLYVVQRQGGGAANASKAVANVALEDAQFRVNGRNVVVNPPASQTMWVPIAGELQEVDNVEALSAPSADAGGQAQPKACGAASGTKPTPPKANADTVNVRAGQPSLVSVLTNDLASSCAPLRIAAFDRVGGLQVDVAKGGAALLVTAPAQGRVSSFEFGYTATDGTQSAAATVSVKVVGRDVNEPPQPPKKIPPLAVAAGSVYTLNALRYFVDPESDPMLLAGAEVSGGGSAEWQPDGTVVVSAPTTPGSMSVTVTARTGGPAPNGKVVSDATATIPFTVGSGKKLLRGDVATVAPNVPIAIDVRANDDGVSAQDLTEPAALSPSSATVVLDRNSGRYVFRADKEGEYSFSYGSGGDATLRGVVLVHVATTTAAPHAVPDLVRVAPDHSAVSEVLANDDDPAGNVLVVGSATVRSATEECRQLVVRVIDGRAVQVTAVGASEGQDCIVSYTLFAGAQMATGTLTVLVDATATNPVLASADSAVVVLGGTAVVPVLANDRIASGEPLVIDPQASVTGSRVFAVAAADGTMRIVAPRTASPGTAIVGYTARGSSDASAAAGGVLRLSVVAPRTAKTVQQLTAADIEARSTVRNTTDPPSCIDVPGAALGTNGGPAIAIPASADPDVVALPGDGAVCPLSAIAFRASTPGTHSFRYSLDDGQATSGVGSVLVGVGPRITQLPIGVDDTVRVRPGRTRVIDVVANDVNSNDAPLRAELCGSATGIAGVGIVPGSRPGTVVATVPAGLTDGARASIAYVPVAAGATSTCGNGPTARLTLVVDRVATAAPIALDDAGVAGSDGVASVDVLANDSDPDGAARSLRVTVDRQSFPSASVVGARVRVSVSESDQWIPYTVTDVDGLTASAVVHVPGKVVRLLVVCPAAAQRPRRAPAGRRATTIDLTGSMCTTAGTPTQFTIVPGQQLADGHGGVATVADARRLRFTPPRDSTAYTAVLSVRVRPFPAPTDTRSVAVPVVLDVSGSRNSPPVLAPASARVTQGGEVTIPLRGSDVDGNAIVYGISGPSVLGGLTVRADRRTGEVRIDAAADAKPGTRQVFTASATDTHGAIATAVIDVSVDKQWVDTPRAQTAVVLSYAKHPSVSIEPFAGLTGDAGWKIDQCQTAPAGMRFSGCSATRYTVGLVGQSGAKSAVVLVHWRDKYGNFGVIRQPVTVIQKPGKPTVTLGGNTSDGCTAAVSQLTFTWPSVDDGGGAVTYSATAASGTVRVAGLQATVSDASRQGPIVLTVSATNESGSTRSDPLSPDLAKAPCWDAGAAVSLTPGDRSISAHWNPATNRSDNGSGVEYHVTVQLAGSDVVAAVTAQTSLTIDALQAGQTYTVVLAACTQGVTNTADPATCTAAETTGSATPYTAPAQHAVTLNEGSGTLVATTDPDANDSADNTTYTFTFFVTAGCSGQSTQTRDGSLQGDQVVAGGPTIVRGQQYFARVVVQNRGGSTLGPCTDAFSFYQQPGVPISLSLTPTGLSGEARLSFVLPSDLGGATAGDLSISVSAGTPATGCTGLHAGSNDCLVRNLVNGSTPSLSVRLQFTKDKTYSSDPVSTVATGTVFGPPGVPAMGAPQVAGTQITFTWQPVPANGRAVDAVQTSFDDAPNWVNQSATQNFFVRNVQYSQTVCILVRAVSSGVTGAAARQCATASGPPVVATSCNGPIRVPCNVARADNGYGRPSAWPIQQCGGPCIPVGTAVSAVCQKDWGGWPGNMVYLQWNGADWWGFDVDYGYPGVPQCP